MGNSNGHFRLSDRIYRKSSHKASQSNTPSPQGPTKRSPPQRGTKIVRQEGYSANLSTIPTRLLVNVLPGAKEVRGLETHPEPKATQSVHTAKKVQDGDSVYRPKISHSRVLGNFLRSQRRLSSRPNISLRSKVASLHASRAGLHLPLSSIRDVHSSKGVYKSSKSCGGRFKRARGSDFYVSRRLVNPIQVSSVNPSGHPISHSDRVSVGVCYQQGQIQPGPVTESRFSRSAVGPGPGVSFPVSGESRQYFRMCHSPFPLPVSQGSGLAEGSRLNGQSSGLGPVLSSPYETNSAPLTLPLQSQISINEHISSDVSHCSRGVGMVDDQIQPDGGRQISISTSSNRSNNRCVQARLGGSSGSPYSERTLVSSGVPSAHKSPRTLGCVPIPQGFFTGGFPQEGSGQVRQFYSGGLYQQAGRDKIPDAVSAYPPDASMVHRSRDSVVSSSHSRLDKHVGRQSVQGGVHQTDGVVFKSPGLPRSQVSQGVSNHRSLCFQNKPSASGLLFMGSGRAGFGVRRSFHPMDRNGSLCFPSNLPHSKGSAEIVQGGLSGSSSGTLVATSVLVSGSGGPPGRCTDRSSPISRSSEDAGVQGQISRSPVPTSDCLDVIKQRYQKEGFSEGVADLVARGRRQSTRKIYSSRLRAYFSWCSCKQVDPEYAPVAQVAEFLTSRFHLGLKPLTVKGYLSAILSIHRGTRDGSSLRRDPALSLLFEGMNNVRPAPRKVWPSWDLPTVLETLSSSPYEPIQSASLRNLTLKTLFLIAIASGRRCSELHALVIGGRTVLAFLATQGLPFILNSGF